MDNYRIGDRAVLKKAATDEVIRQLADVTGDINPVHLNEEYASATIFRKRIAHGLFCLGMISNLIGNQLPGRGSILVSQEIKYHKPVYLDDCIEACVEITEIIENKNKIILSCVCSNQDAEVVLEGRAVVHLQ